MFSVNRIETSSTQGQSDFKLGEGLECLMPCCMFTLGLIRSRPVSRALEGITSPKNSGEADRDARRRCVRLDAKTMLVAAMGGLTV